MYPAFRSTNEETRHDFVHYAVDPRLNFRNRLILYWMGHIDRVEIRPA